MTVFLDAGSANLAIAQAIGPDLSATIITNTPPIAAALMEKPGIEVMGFAFAMFSIIFDWPWRSTPG